MIEHVYKKDSNQGGGKYKYFSTPFLNAYYPKRKNVIKNYVLDPDTKNIK